MSLQWTPLSSQRVVIRRDAAIDNPVVWSWLGDIYVTTLSPGGRCDYFKKGHAKRVGFEPGFGVLVKQNFVGGLIQAAATVFDEADVWYTVAVVVTATRGHIYFRKGATGPLAEVGSYTENIQDAQAQIEQDAVDDQWGQPGNVILGNEGGRDNYQRGANGSLWRSRWWGDIRTLDELQLERDSYRAITRTNLFGCYRVGADGREIVRDSFGGRHGYVFARS